MIRSGAETHTLPSGVNWLELLNDGSAFANTGAGNVIIASNKDSVLSGAEADDEQLPILWPVQTGLHVLTADDFITVGYAWPV